MTFLNIDIFILLVVPHQRLGCLIFFGYNRPTLK